MNTNFTPVLGDPCQPSQPSQSQSPDTSEGISTSSPLPEEGKPSSLDGTTGDRPPSQDANEGRGETAKQIPRVSLASSIIDANTDLTPIHHASHKPSQPFSSQSYDASKDTPVPIPSPGASNSPALNDATGGISPGRDGNMGPGETERQTPNVSIASSIIRSRSLPLSAQDGPNDTDDKVQRVRIEPERTGWARMYDLVREVDKTRIVDNKEDIDTLLVFVSLYIASSSIPN